MAEKRNYGIDLLRIVCMYMVIVLHIIGQGGVLEATTRLSANYTVAWFIRIAVYCAVNCYGLISGYIGIDAKYKYSNLFVLWLRVAFYSIMITVCFRLVAPETVGGKEVVNALFPVMRSQYWYFTAYFCIFFFMPVFHFIVQTMPEKQLRMLIVALIVVFSILPTIFHVDAFGTNGGYSALWLGILYILGAYIKKYNLFCDITSKRMMAIYVFCVVLTWGSRLSVEYAAWAYNGKFISGNYFDVYTSPTMLIAAVSLLMIFARMHIAPATKKIVQIIAPLSFSVYLIHVQPLVWSYLFKNWVKQYADFGPFKLFVMVLVTAFILYISCLLIDLVRQFLFQRLKIRETADRIEQQIREKMKMLGEKKK